MKDPHHTMLRATPGRADPIEPNVPVVHNLSLSDLDATQLKRLGLISDADPTTGEASQEAREEIAPHSPRGNLYAMPSTPFDKIPDWAKHSD